VTKGQRALIGWTGALLLSLALWAVAFAAFAQLPPLAYRGPVQITVQFTDAQNVEGLCGMITEGRLRNVEACANEQVMILPDPCTYPGRYAEVVCHEIGHSHGWVHREPSA
jgi:hypothetical protein